MKKHITALEMNLVMVENTLATIKDNSIEYIKRCVSIWNTLNNHVHKIPMRFMDIDDIVEIQIECNAALYDLIQFEGLELKDLQEHVNSLYKVRTIENYQEVTNKYFKKLNRMYELRKQYKDNRMSIIRNLENIKFKNLENKENKLDHIQKVCELLVPDLNGK